MGYVLTAVVAILLGLFVNYISPPFNRFVGRCFSWLFHLFDPDRFDLSGMWEQTFHEREPQNLDEFREVKETVRLKHLGNTVSGNGKTDIDPRDISYPGRIEHNLFFGSYVKKRRERQHFRKGDGLAHRCSRSPQYGRTGHMVRSRHGQD